MSIISKCAAALFAFFLCTSVFAAGGDSGIQNPTANSIGDYQGIDSNQSSGSTLACTYTPVTTGTQNVAYTGATPSASGGVAPYTFSETGSLPTGLSINSSTGIISGTPSVNGSFPTIQVKVTDSALTVANCGASFTLVIAPPAFQGAGDIVSSATFWGSCSRVYDVALASTSTSLCDLVDSSAPSVPICTLRGTATGFVDLAGAYCTGSVTPATKCAAATGGVCNISKIYDQTGNSNHLTNTTAANQPKLSFSSLNSLPGVKCSQSDPDIMNGPSLTLAQPMTFSSVWERTANFTNATLVYGTSAAVTFGNNTTAGNVLESAGTPFTTAATDSVFHAVQGVVNGASSALVVDGSATTGSAGASGFSAVAMRFCRNSVSLDGIVMEVGLWPSAFNATQYGNMNTNQHGTSGYNF